MILRVYLPQAGRNGLYRSFKRLKVNNSVTDGANHALKGDVLLMGILC